MSDWKVISHTAPVPPGCVYRLEVGIEAEDGGWAQVRVREFDNDASYDNLSEEEVAASQRAKFLVEIEAEWYEALEPGSTVESLPQLPGVGEEL